MVAGLRQESLVDEKRCWEEWARLGSLGEVSLLFEREGIKNQVKGTPPTKSTIQKAGYRYALKNQEDARRTLAAAWRNRNKPEILTEEKWKVILARGAKLAIPDRKRYESFIAQNALQAYAE